MRTLFCLLLLAAVAALPAGAHAFTRLALYTDAVGYQCNLIDGVQQPHNVYVFVDWSTGTLGTRFRVVQSHDATLLYLDETPNAAYFSGNSQNGITLCFSECTTAKRPILDILYFGFGTSPVCAGIRIEPVPGALDIESVNCAGDVEQAFALDMSINDDATCPCYLVSKTPPRPQTTARPLAAEDNFCAGVPVEQTTWGRVKSLYR